MKSFRMQVSILAAVVFVCLAAVAIAASGKLVTSRPSPRARLPMKPAAATKADAASDKAIAAIDAQIAAAKVNKGAQGWKMNLPMPKAVTFTPGKVFACA